MFEGSPDHGAMAAALLNYYSFDLGDYSGEEIVGEWGENYEYYWIYLAAVEALYQGRYKSISVEQILSIWRRRGKPIYHFNWEFEQLISRNLSPALIPTQTLPETPETAETSPPESPASPDNSQPSSPPTRPPFSSTKPPKTSPSIHTDFMVKLIRIWENSQKTLPPARLPPEDEL